MSLFGMEPPAGRTCLTVLEVARLLSATPTHVINLIEEGRLPAINIGTDLRRHYRIPVGGYIHFIKQNGLS